VLFVTISTKELTKDFFIELFLVALLMIVIRVTWYGVAEEKRENKADFIEAKNTYFDRIDKEIVDIVDFEKYLHYLNLENKINYIESKTRLRNRKNYKHYDKYKQLVVRKAENIREITAMQIIARTDKVHLADATDYRHRKKAWYVSSSAILSVCLSTLLAYVAYENISMNEADIIKYVTYLAGMAYTAYSAIQKGDKTTWEEFVDYVSRCQFILDKYKTWKSGGINKNVHLLEERLGEMVKVGTVEKLGGDVNTAIPERSNATASSTDAEQLATDRTSDVNSIQPTNQSNEGTGWL
jgi:hypothetical protein